MKRHAILLGAELLLLAANTAIIVRIRHDSSDLDQQAHDLLELAVKVEQQSDKLKALAASVSSVSSCGKASPESLMSSCAVIHKPESGCPSGYALEKSPRFTERDGSKQFACVSRDPSKDHCTDILRPGESMEMILEIPVPEPETPKT
jgi:hypothetical protein